MGHSRSHSGETVGKQCRREARTHTTGTHQGMHHPVHPPPRVPPWHDRRGVTVMAGSVTGQGRFTRLLLNTVRESTYPNCAKPPLTPQPDTTMDTTTGHHKKYILYFSPKPLSNPRGNNTFWHFSKNTENHWKSWNFTKNTENHWKSLNFMIFRGHPALNTGLFV